MAGDGVPDPHLPQAGDPTSATTAFVLRIAGQSSALVATQIAVINARIDGVEAASAAHRDGLHQLFVQRLNDLDRANTVLADNVTRVPTQLQTAVAALKELESVKFEALDDELKAAAALRLAQFSAVDQRFLERDDRAAEALIAAKEALAAALASAKEAVQEQNKANATAIGKSETGVQETIAKLSELVSVNIAGLAREIAANKELVNAVRQELLTTAGALRQESIAKSERSAGSHDQRTDSKAAINMVVGIIGAIVAVVVVALSLYAAVKP